MVRIILVIFLSIVLLTGDYLVKLATESANKAGLLVLAGFLWVASIPGWYYVVNGHRIAVTGALFAVTSIIGTTAIGIFLFKEKVSVAEIVGIILAIASMMLLARKL